MSILTFPTASRPQGSHPFSAPQTNPIAAALASLVGEWRLWKASRAMESLSDEMLHDIGVSRSDIADVTRYGRPSRF